MTTKKCCPACEKNKIQLLAQAERILVNKFTIDHERVLYLIDRGLVDPLEVNWPDPPSSDIIIEEAKKLYRFAKEEWLYTKLNTKVLSIVHTY